MTELDDIDRRIVAALQAEGRLPIVDLADKVGLSPTPCQRRVRRLEEEGVITRYAALVSPSALGLGLQALVQVTPAHLGLPTDAPPLARARDPTFDEAS